MSSISAVYPVRRQHKLWKWTRSPLHGQNRRRLAGVTSAVRAFPVKVTARPHSPLVRDWVTMARAAVAIQIVENDMPKKVSQAFTMSAEAADCPRFPTSLCRYWRAGGEA